MTRCECNKFSSQCSTWINGSLPTLFLILSRSSLLNPASANRVLVIISIGTNPILSFCSVNQVLVPHGLDFLISTFFQIVKHVSSFIILSTPQTAIPISNGDLMNNLSYNQIHNILRPSSIGSASSETRLIT